MTWALLLLACKADPPPLYADLDGGWDIEFTVFGGADRQGTADLAYDEEENVLFGEIVMEDPDAQRIYDVLGAEDIEDLGIALQLIEATGVRQLFVETAVVESDDVIGGWRTRWGCSRGQCGEDGGLTLLR